MLKSLFSSLHNRSAIGKIVENNTYDVTVAELKKCGKFETVLVLRRNPSEVWVTSGQKPSNKIIYIVLQTSVGLF